MKLLGKSWFVGILIALFTIPIYADDNDPLGEIVRQACEEGGKEHETWYHKYFSFDSVFCQKRRAQGFNFDVEEELKRNNITLKQVDLDRIYGTPLERKLPSKLERECTYTLPGSPAGVDSFCTKIREDLAAKNIDMSLQQYERLDNACHRDRDCINDHAKKWQSNKPSYPPKKQVGGLNLDDLMGGNMPANKPSTTNNLFAEPTSTAIAIKPSQPATQKIDFDSPVPNTASKDPTQGDIGFENIYANRETIRINDIKQTLFDKNEIVASRCQCAFNQTSCFTSDKYSHSNLNKAMSQVDANFESEMDQMCMTWVDLLQGKTSDDEQQLKVFINNSDIIARNLDKLQSSYHQTKKKLWNKEYEIDRAIARQEEQRRQQQQSSGFNWGKMIALSSGLAIGAGMGDLGGAETMELMGRITMDSMEGVEGIDNFNAGIGNITQIHNEHFAAMANIEQQTNQMNAANEANYRAQQGQQAPAYEATTDYNDLLSDNAVKRNLTPAYDASNNMAEQALKQQQALNQQANNQQISNNSDSAVGAYVASNHWKTCVVLDSGGIAHYKPQTLENWNNPHANYVWNQPARSGSWTMNGDKVTVDVSGYEVNPTTGARSPKQHNFTVTLRGNVLGDATKVGQGLNACR
jgi:hypothetical protein